MRSRNQEGFEALASLASAFSNDARLLPLCRYYELRRQGLRRQAFAQLDTFLEQASSWETSHRRAIALCTLDAFWRISEAHELLTEPLRRRFLEPVLQEWLAADPESPVAFRQLALLRRNRDLLEQALERDPSDVQVRLALAARLVDGLAYATHELPYGLLGDREAVAADLAKAKLLLSELPESALVPALAEILSGIAMRFEDWDDAREGRGDSASG
jgi:hypothetical protein